MNRAEVQMGLGNVKAFLNNTLVTMGLGLAFFVGVVAIEWQLAAEEGVLAGGHVEGGVFYMMTGMHAFHVLTGLIFLFVVWRNARKGVYTQEKHFVIEAATVYWHFVDLVWIFFYPALYLIGTAIK
jgi:cytochrome c oxidase subunit 3